MSEELKNIKDDMSALERAVTEAGGKLGPRTGRDERKHNSCPICGSGTGGDRGNATEGGFSLYRNKEGGARWKCWATCAGLSGSIIDLVMHVEHVDNKEASVRVLKRFGREVGGQRSEVRGQKNGNGEGSTGTGVPEPVPQKKEGKLHLNPDLACDALLWGIQKTDPGAQFAKRWNYTNEKGEPVFTVARFNLSNGGKEIKPIRRDGNGWRSGLGEWGKDGKLMPMYGLARIVKAVKEMEKVGV